MDIGSASSTTLLLAYMPHAFAAVDAALQDSPAKTLATLGEKVRHWRDEHGFGLSDLDCERLAGWLNRTVYHLK
jgi:hypothetical protein